MPKKTVENIQVDGKRVLLRVDFNVPMTAATREICDDSRIVAALPTIKYLTERRAKVILCSHLGRPKGRVIEELRLAPIARRLSELIGVPVATASDCVGPEVEEKVAGLKEGDVLLLENVRFHPEEEQNDARFAEQLAGMAELYVDDAFGSAHRAHASTVGVTRHLPSVCGLLMARELRIMGELLEKPRGPAACLVGGAKVSDKMGLLQRMIERVDVLLVGGGMAATFLKAQGCPVGRSMVEDDRLELAAALIQTAAASRVSFLLPSDVIVAEELVQGAATQTVIVADIPDNAQIVDIGPQSAASFCAELGKCRTVFWNGPMGIYEIPAFSEGTSSIARCVSMLDATTIIGGGSTAEIVHKMGLTDRMTHVSTGGGASLRFLEGADLPGVDALLDK